MSVEIVATPGETTLIDTFKQAGVEIIIENLLVGDLHIRKQGVPVYIIERKAKGDLDASIKDGRYREQKARLIETGLPRKSIIFVIEALSKPGNAAAHKRIWSAICNSQHRDGFTVFQTRSIAETVDYIVALARSTEQFDPVNSTNCDASSDGVGAVNVNIKKRAVSPDEWLMYALTLVPGCSLNIAKVIVGTYGTLQELNGLYDESGPDSLAELRHGPSQRRLGKKLSRAIGEYIT